MQAQKKQKQGFGGIFLFSDKGKSACLLFQGIPALGSKFDHLIVGSY